MSKFDPQNHLSKHGWTEGAGLGRNEHGIKEAIKVKLKFDQAGMGHDQAEQFTYHWWDHVFNKAAKSLTVNNDTEGVSVSSTGSVDISSKKQTVKVDRSDMLYGRFVKAATLNSEGSEVKESKSSDKAQSEDAVGGSEDSSSDSDGETDIGTASKLTDEELHRVCGGRTAHKGARHGLGLSGKLARAAEQEQSFINSTTATPVSSAPPSPGQPHSEPVSSAPVSSAPVRSEPVSSAPTKCGDVDSSDSPNSAGDNKRKQKKSKKSKKCRTNKETESNPDVEDAPGVDTFDKDGLDTTGDHQPKPKKCKKSKKCKKEKKDVDLADNDAYSIECIDSVPGDVHQSKSFIDSNLGSECTEPAQIKSKKSKKSRKEKQMDDRIISSPSSDSALDSNSLPDGCLESTPDSKSSHSGNLKPKKSKKKKREIEEMDSSNGSPGEMDREVVEKKNKKQKKADLAVADDDGDCDNPEKRKKSKSAGSVIKVDEETKVKSKKRKEYPEDQDSGCEVETEPVTKKLRVDRSEPVAEPVTKKLRVDSSEPVAEPEQRKKVKKSKR